MRFATLPSKIQVACIGYAKRDCLTSNLLEMEILNTGSTTLNVYCAFQSTLAKLLLFKSILKANLFLHVLMFFA